MIPTCMKQFTWKKRRHHCRYCGRIICGDCSANKLPHFSRDSKELVRVCSLCWNKYKKCFPDFDPRKINSSKASLSSLIGKTTSMTSFTDAQFTDDDTDSDTDTNASGPQFRPYTPSIDSVKETKPINASHNHSQSQPVNSTTNPYVKSNNNTAFSKYNSSVKPKKIAISKTKSTPSASPVKTTSDQQFFDDQKLNHPQPSHKIQSSSDITNSTLNIMKQKLENERKKSKQLQERVNDLTDENKRLRKSKVYTHIYIHAMYHDNISILYRLISIHGLEVKLHDIKRKLRN